MFTQENIKTLDPKVFREAVEAFGEGFKGNEDIAATTSHLSLENKDGTVDEIAFTNHPEVRGMFSMKRYFNDDEDSWHSASFRWWGLRELFAKGTSDWWKSIDDATEIHEAVFQVAAEMDLNMKGHFNQKKFDRAVAELIARQDT